MPLAAAALFAVVSPASLIAVDAVSYVASALLIRTIVRPLSDPRELASPLSRSALVADVREGLAFLWSHATVRSMTAVGAAQSIAGGAFMGQMVIWAALDLGVKAGGWRLGVLFSSWGVGVVPRLVRRLGAARLTLLPPSRAR